MGNCVFKGFRLEVEEMIEVVTPNGGIMEFTALNNSTTKNSLSSSTSSSKLTPYRMSLDNQRMLKRSSAEAEVFPRYNSIGVWKVLVISPEQLAEILAQEARTEELIESVRTVAKCGNGVSTSVANPDHSSLSSSWKGLSDQKYGVDI
ncbi:hypothetical protein DKX38_003061 [Salix brachista]|uniref:Uncharacterized protein n=1 Tax=Salix brachista TaxID=2182728 RepID=A0A5N5NQN5_9ROSI|nr:hypothetical protein DKX38_003061 [Salix brachista]